MDRVWVEWLSRSYYAGNRDKMTAMPLCTSTVREYWDTIYQSLVGKSSFCWNNLLIEAISTRCSTPCEQVILVQIKWNVDGDVSKPAEACLWNRSSESGTWRRRFRSTNFDPMSPCNRSRWHRGYHNGRKVCHRARHFRSQQNGRTLSNKEWWFFGCFLALDMLTKEIISRTRKIPDGVIFIVIWFYWSTIRNQWNKADELLYIQ